MKEAACFQEKLMGGDRLLVVTAGERLALQRICWNWQNKQERSTRDTEPGSTENVGPQGLRVRTTRFWEPGTMLIVQSCGNELWARKKSRPVRSVGRQILARAGGWTAP